MKNRLDWSTLVANLITIFWWLWIWFIFIKFFWIKRIKAIIVNSNTFSIPPDESEIRGALFPNKIMEETIKIDYDNNINAQEFCKENNYKLKDIKERYVYFLLDLILFTRFYNYKMI